MLPQPHIHVEISGYGTHGPHSFFLYTFENKKKIKISKNEIKKKIKKILEK